MEIHTMKHLRRVTVHTPARAQDMGTGMILKVISQILTVIGAYLSGKEESEEA